MLTYRLDHLPFSMPGSYLTISARASSGSGRLLYQTCSQMAITPRNMVGQARDFFELALLRDGSEVNYTCTAQPHRLDLHAEAGGSAALAFADPSTICFEATGVTLRLLPCKPMAVAYSPAAGTLCLVDWSGRGHHQMRAGGSTELRLTGSQPLSGDAHRSGISCTVDFLGNSGAFRFSRFERLFQDTLPPFAEVVQARQKEWEKWLTYLPPAPPRYRQTAEQAWYMLWSGQVAASGLLTRPVIFMSKFRMNNIWSWDNCFSALAIARADPQAAWNQILLFFEHAEPNGMAPDQINDLYEHFCFTKPPIHGWTIKKLVSQIGAEQSLPYLSQLYRPMCRLTEWWYTMRDFDRDGVCQYHHGNDSGWDNATAFDHGFPTESADLSAHLVLQCEGLSYIANLLGKKHEAQHWRKRATEQLQAFLRHSIRDHRFVSPLDGVHTAIETQSLLNYIPSVLGCRLPPDVRQTIAADLQPGGAFLTDWGLATESPHSQKYETNGYWRGPIWAPSTYLIVDGLNDMGETALAREIAGRFCTMCANDPGFWENFDALTGKGLDCPAYSWTAAVFLLLAEYLVG
jgi:glycogen debranching enzyme